MCFICLDNEETILSCLCKKSICRECFVNGVEHSITANTIFKCDCGLAYDNDIIFQTIGPVLAAKYQKYILEKEIKIYNCGNCNETCDVGEYTLKDYFCYFCKANTCFRCKQPSHDGECMKDKAEPETEKYVIKCCGVVFIRGDACNKVKCPTCKIPYCWICKKKNIDYTHFVEEGPGCHLFGERKGDVVKKPKVPVVRPQPVVQPLVVRPQPVVLQPTCYHEGKWVPQCQVICYGGKGRQCANKARPGSNYCGKVGHAK